MTEIELTKSEKLFINRRRQNKTQIQAAKDLGVSLSRYSKFETRNLDNIPDTEIESLQPHEYCVIKRRRAGMTQTDLGVAMNRCRWWIHQMETGVVDPGDLLDYWG